MLDRYVVEGESFQLDGLQVAFTGKEILWQIVKAIVAELTKPKSNELEFISFGVKKPKTHIDLSNLNGLKSSDDIWLSGI